MGRTRSRSTKSSNDEQFSVGGSKLLRAAARETGAVLVVEDHVAGGGLGDPVAAEVGSIAPLLRLAVSELPRSGTGVQLLDYCGISRRAIKECVPEQMAAA